MSGAGRRRRRSLAAGMLAASLLGRAPGFAASPVPGAQAAAPAQEDIRDIRLPDGRRPLWIWAALLGGTVSIVLIAVILGRRRRGAPPAASPVDTAVRRLEAARELMRPDTADEFSVAVSSILRDYVEQAFQLTATRRTTEEFLRELVQSPNALPAPRRSELAEFLQHCDLAKFAGTPPTQQGMQWLYLSARAFVEVTARPSHDPLTAA